MLSYSLVINIKHYIKQVAGRTAIRSSSGPGGGTAQLLSCTSSPWPTTPGDPPCLQHTVHMHALVLQAYGLSTVPHTVTLLLTIVSNK